MTSDLQHGPVTAECEACNDTGIRPTADGIGHYCERGCPVPAEQPAPDVREGIDVDALANEIRRVDGDHSLGAGALAEALSPYILALIEVERAKVREEALAAVRVDPEPVAWRTPGIDGTWFIIERPEVAEEARGRGYDLQRLIVHPDDATLQSIGGENE